MHTTNSERGSALRGRLTKRKWRCDLVVVTSCLIASRQDSACGKQIDVEPQSQFLFYRIGSRRNCVQKVLRGKGERDWQHPTFSFLGAPPFSIIGELHTKSINGCQAPSDAQYPGVGPVLHHQLGALRSAIIALCCCLNRAQHRRFLILSQIERPSSPQ